MSAGIAPTPPSASPPRWPGWFTALVCVGLMAWAATDGNRWGVSFPVGGQGQDYYNLLVDGLLEGHLSMKVSPDASGKLPVLMDASLFQGKYYLYFGVVPAVLTFLPFSLITGGDLPPNLVTWLFVAAGFLLSLRLYARARARHFPHSSRSVDLAATLLLAFGTGTPVLLFNADSYEVALAAGCGCFSALLLGVYEALQADRHGLRWLALASLAGGLAVGCRPTYVTILPLLLMPVLLTVRSERRRALGAAVLPAAAVGLLLAAYNHGRFGDPFDFGFKHQVNALMSSGLPFARAAFMGPNLQWYYLTPPELSPYFPYVLPINASARPADYYGYELVHGEWLVWPLLVAVTLITARAFRRGQPPAREVRFAAAFAVGAFVVLLATLSTFGFRANRYVVDFQPALIAGLALLGACGLASPGLPRDGGSRVLRLFFVASAVSLAGFNLLAGLQWMDRLASRRPQVSQTLAYYGNFPSHWLHELGLITYGPVRFEATFAKQTQAVREPLLAVGTNGYADVLYAAQHPSGQVELLLDHRNTGGLRSELLPIQPGVPHILEIDVGGLYPPEAHPFFKDWPADRVRRLKTRARVLLDGVPVIDGHQTANDAPPGALAIGANPRNLDPQFSGKIRAIERLTPRLDDPPREFGIWSLELEFPRNGLNGGQPLLASGITGRGNLLFVDTPRAGEIRFGFDQWGHRLDYSQPVPITMDRAHRLDILVGPQIAAQAAGASWGLSPQDRERLGPVLQVWLDGRLAWQIAIEFHRQSYDKAATAINLQGFSTAAPAFGGVHRRIMLSDDDKRLLLRRSLAADGNQPSPVAP
jgi:hypothetical protein